MGHRTEGLRIWGQSAWVWLLALTVTTSGPQLPHLYERLTVPSAQAAPCGD